MKIPPYISIINEVIKSISWIRYLVTIDNKSYYHDFLLFVKIRDMSSEDKRYIRSKHFSVWISKYHHCVWCTIFLFIPDNLFCYILWPSSYKYRKKIFFTYLWEGSHQNFFIFIILIQKMNTLFSLLFRGKKILPACTERIMNDWLWIRDYVWKYTKIFRVRFPKRAQLQ